MALSRHQTNWRFNQDLLLARLFISRMENENESRLFLRHFGVGGGHVNNVFGPVRGFRLCYGDWRFNATRGFLYNAKATEYTTGITV